MGSGCGGDVGGEEVVRSEDSLRREIRASPRGRAFCKEPIELQSGRLRMRCQADKN